MSWLQGGAIVLGLAVAVLAVVVFVCVMRYIKAESVGEVSKLNGAP